MARNKISQREARRLRQKVGELMRERDQLFSRFRNDISSGIPITTASLSSTQDELIELARRMGYVVIVKREGSIQKFYAVK